jgi:predicted acetyltransferase
VVNEVVNNASVRKEKVTLPAGYQIVRVEQDEQFQQCADLWSLCFGLDSEFHAESELKFAKHHASHVFAVQHRGRICATLAVVDFEMQLNGKIIACAGIANVATDPSHRRGNLVKGLMLHSLSALHAENVPVTALHPFSFPYYERMGFATTTFSYKIKVPTAWCRSIAKSGDSRNYSLTPLTDFEPAAQVHERSLERWNVTLRRPKQRWQLKLFEFGAKWRMFCHSDGYMLWNTRKVEPMVLHISEWNYLTQDALLDGLALLGTMESQVDFVEWIDGDVRPLLHLGMPHPAPQFELVPKLMTRVLNLQAFETAIGKVSEKICDPLGISAPAALDDERAGAIGPGTLIQRVTGLCGVVDPANPLGMANSVLPFGPNYCNDFF